MSFGCQDRGCIFDPPNQGTNGGCRCLKDVKPSALRIELARKIKLLKEKLQK